MITNCISWNIFKMFTMFKAIILSLVTYSIYCHPVYIENDEIKEFVVQDNKLVYKMRHDFWPVKETRYGGLPILENISRKRRSVELQPKGNEENGAETRIPEAESTEFPVTHQVPNNNLQGNVRQPNPTINPSDHTEHLEVTDQTQSTTTDDSEIIQTVDLILLGTLENLEADCEDTENDFIRAEIELINKSIDSDLAEAASTLVFRPLFAYKYKKRRRETARRSRS